MDKLNKKSPIVCAISGGGRTLANLLAQQSLPDAAYKVVGVISSSVSAKGNEIAQAHGIEVFVGDFGKEVYESTVQDLEKFICKLNPEYILLCGFIKKFPSLADFSNRIVNIHPALLPKFGGKGMYGNYVHQAVLDAKESESGASIHFVTEQYDEGALIAQAHVKISEYDSVETLANKVFAVECKLYPTVINELINGELPLRNREIKHYYFD